MNERPNTGRESMNARIGEAGQGVDVRSEYGLCRPRCTVLFHRISVKYYPNGYPRPCIRRHNRPAIASSSTPALP